MEEAGEAGVDEMASVPLGRAMAPSGSSWSPGFTPCWRASPEDSVEVEVLVIGMSVAVRVLAGIAESVDTGYSANKCKLKATEGHLLMSTDRLRSLSPSKPYLLWW